jgi:hypothetical protein
VVPSWLTLCWIAQGSGFESQRGNLFGISPRGEISQEGFAHGFPSCHESIYRVSRVISEAPLVFPNGCLYLLKKMGGWSFTT